MTKKYWDINLILPFQRCFNFINAERSIGKTYTTQKFIINKAIKNNLQFVYLVRTQDEKKKGIFKNSFEKVLQQEFKEYEFAFSTEEIFLINRDENKEITSKILIGFCLALSESVKVKKRSFPNVKYLIFDEYMLEKKQGGQYVGGWKEPDLFLSIYHTIDRESDKVICFLLGNNTSFYNPYHLHKAFNIPHIEKGGLWTSENVLFQWANSSTELKKEKSNCKFLNMLEGTKYGEYAKDGNYTDDNINFIEKNSSTSRYAMTLEYEGNSFGIYNDIKRGRIYITNKVDKSCKFVYALTLEDHNENTMLTKSGHIAHLSWLSKNFKLGNVRFESMDIKLKAEGGIIMLL